LFAELRGPTSVAMFRHAVGNEGNLQNVFRLYTPAEDAATNRVYGNLVVALAVC
jgi:hypothetical protein